MKIYISLNVYFKQVQMFPLKYFFWEIDTINSLYFKTFFFIVEFSTRPVMLKTCSEHVHACTNLTTTESTTIIKILKFFFVDEIFFFFKFFD